MSDFPLDEDLHTPTISPAQSESTVILDAPLNPFSPDLTPTQLTFDLHRLSGHIPVVLYDEDYVCSEPLHLEGLSISDFSLASVNAGHHGTQFQYGTRISAVQPLSVSDSNTATKDIPSMSAGNSGTDRTSRATATESLYLGSNVLDSSNTINSVGTFGPKHESRQQISDNSQEEKQDHAEESEHLLDSPSLSQHFPTSISLSRGTIGVERSSISFSRKRKSSNVTSLNLSDMFSSPSVFSDGTGNLKRASLMAKMDSYDTNPSEPRKSGLNKRTSNIELDAGENGEVSLAPDDQDDSDRDSDPLTPRKAIPKNISWISSRDWDYKQYKDYVAQEDLHNLPRSPSPVAHVDVGNTSISPRRRTPTRLNVLPVENRDLNVIVETPRASQFARELHGHEKQPPNSNQGRISPPAQQIHSDRADEHTWLRDITMQFLIDQEGFRAAHPSFRFTGVARIRPSLNLKASLIVMAQFRPVARQAFHFHYAPFESPPILRRVTVNFDETHDYLSKQALLTLKTNGVYVLHGHEMSHSTPEGEPTKLFWQFEYLIDDRRLETSGRIMEGEKIMTPLTFSCTPALLLPSQGKRNSIMHVFKKGVAPKLIAERLQPPGIPPAPKKPTVDKQVAETDAPAANFFTSKAHAWNLHRRGQSHGVHSPNSQKQTGAPSFRGVHKESENINPISPHRRALSGGENNVRSPPRPRFDPLVSPTKQTAVVMERPAPSRHILPPQKLAELLDTSRSPEKPITHRPPSIRNSSQFIPLTPRPRQATGSRDPMHIR